MGGGGSGMMGGAGGAASASPQGTPLNAADFTVQSAPIVVAGQQVGTAEIYAPKGARAAAEDAYQSALTRNLVIAAAIAGVLALLVSLLVSRRITGPLEELTDAAGDVSAGNLDVRVAPRGDDEVAALAAAFNSMADRLARDEQWRRDMTSDLSHELRTPLATIQSRVEALEDGILPPTPENLRVIGEEVERLGRLLGALRSLNELESEDLSVEHEPVDLAEVAAGAADRHRPAFLTKGVELTEDLQPGVVLGDRDRLLQVVANLLDNALKFTPAGGHVVLAVDTLDRRDERGRRRPGGARRPVRASHGQRRRSRRGCGRPAVRLRPVLPRAGDARHVGRRPRPRHLPRAGRGAGRLDRRRREARAAAPGSPCCCRPPDASEARRGGADESSPAAASCSRATWTGRCSTTTPCPSPGAGEAVAELIAAGALFAVCHGAPAAGRATRRRARSASEPLIYACYHGALVAEASGRVLRHLPLPPREAGEIAAQALAAGVAVTVWDVDEPRELEPDDGGDAPGDAGQPARPPRGARRSRAAARTDCVRSGPGGCASSPSGPASSGSSRPPWTRATPCASSPRGSACRRSGRSPAATGRRTSHCSRPRRCESPSGSRRTCSVTCRTSW